MSPPEFLLRSRRVLTAGGLRPASVRVRHGRIAAVDEYGPASASERPRGAPVEDLGDAILFPGLVDTHVHVDDPGRADWEGFETATAAAAAGGITTIVDMPLNSVPPTTTLGALWEKGIAAAGRISVDVGFWGGIVPGNLSDVAPLRAAGVFGFKCFLAPSGVPEFSEVGESDLRAAMRRLADPSVAAPLLVHAEDPGRLLGAPREGRRSYRSYLASRPRAAENEAVERVVRLCRETGARAHILHLSSAEALDTIASAKREGLGVSAETCPHYLTFAAEEIEDGATVFKCAPPIRERENRDRLWDGLASGVIDMVVSDHSPCPPAAKHSGTGDFFDAWGGIASLELGISAVWTAAADRGIPPERLAEWMSAAPARLAGLDHVKGRIAPGRPADLVVWDPDARRNVDSAALAQRHKITPYAGRALRGAVRATYLGGEKIFDGERLVAAGRGEMLLCG